MLQCNQHSEGPENAPQYAFRDPKIKKFSPQTSPPMGPQFVRSTFPHTQILDPPLERGVWARGRGVGSLQIFILIWNLDRPRPTVNSYDMMLIIIIIYLPRKQLPCHMNLRSPESCTYFLPFLCTKYTVRRIHLTALSLRSNSDRQRKHALKILSNSLPHYRHTKSAVKQAGSEQHNCGALP